MPIYTRFGDRGETRLFDGARVPKHDLRVRAYGGVDELNSALGVALAEIPPSSDIRELLIDIQKHLMAVGAALANPAPSEGDADAAKGRVDPEWIGQLEAAIDRYETELPPLQRFILPGGSRAGACLHLTRTVCRRAEREVSELSRVATVEPAVLGYINRLSDLLFVLARAANFREGMDEILW
jgi:cob(I)alamin adenosyltransferase